ncbi:unnamed protein product [Mycena citricolor]|uniref:C2H2-type domain-containing protein n=1 Tax=Mycena citricolor TaxID=2018698 RepID=A0AAD2JYP5_9AGAR|nr:unnamed protein product [Mycena citricolor]
MHTHIDEPSDTSTRSSPISSTPSSQADLDNMLTSACMWGDCADRFNGPLDLAEHVNVAHLPGKTHYDPPAMACQWKDCSVYPTPYSMPGPSSGDFDTFFGLLSSHLLHDHLGLGYVPECGEHHHHSKSSVEETAPAPTAAVAEHVCRWALCGESFTSSDDLTQHLANAHVGSGKMAYDCFWGDCSRHGDNGFTSKQKLSRHLQSHTKHRPFQCQICMQHFSEAATLQQHMRRHTLESE